MDQQVSDSDNSDEPVDDGDSSESSDGSDGSDGAERADGPDGDCGSLYDPDDDAVAPRRRSWLSCLGIIGAACVLIGSGLTWLFWDDIFYPFGDPRACAGSDTALPAVITTGGVELPDDASEVRYYTHDGQATVSFVSDQVLNYLMRGQVIVDTVPPLFDGNHKAQVAVEAGQTELPEGLCGEGVRGPAWDLFGNGGEVIVEHSPYDFDTVRTPARVQVTFGIPMAGTPSPVPRGW